MSSSPSDTRFSVEQVLTILRNLGIDTDCGACMEVGFTGLTTHPHTCPTAQMTIDVDQRPETPTYERCICDFPGDNPDCPIDHDQVQHEMETS